MTTQTPRPDDDLTTHPVGSEMVEKDELHRPPRPGDASSKVTWWVIKVFLLVLALALFGAFLAYRSPALIIIAVILFAAMMMLFLAPVLLARGTKIAEDDAARRQ